MMAYTFDVLTILLLISSPFWLAYLAKSGAAYRMAAGVSAILIGVFLVIPLWFSDLINWEAHWFLANVLEFIGIALLPISIVLIAVLPLVYIGFGVRFLIKKKSIESRSSRKIWLGIGAVLLCVYIMFQVFMAIGTRTHADHTSHTNAGHQAYNARDFPAAESHFLAALKAAEDFGRKGSTLARLFGIRPTDEVTGMPTIRDNLLRDSLINLAEVYEAQGQYEKAAPLLKRNLAIAERGLGADSDLLGTPIERYAALLRKMNRETEAARLEERLRAIRLKETPGAPNAQ